MKLLTFIFSAFIAVSSPVWANSSTVKIISSFPAGSGPDTLSRKVAEQMSLQLKVPVIIDNRPGGNGAVAMNQALNEKNSDDIILYASNDNLVVYPLLTNDYQLISNFKPLKEALWSDLVLATGPNVKSVKEIFQSSRVSYGSWGIGSAPHLMASELSNSQKHKDSVHVPYKEYGAWFTDINNGALSFSFVTIASTSNLEKAGKIKYLAIASERRNSQYPTLPTMKELTNHPLTLVGWAGLYTPTTMTSSRAQELKLAMDNAYQSPEVLETARALNYNLRNFSTDEFKNVVQQDQEKYKEIIRRYNIKIN